MRPAPSHLNRTSPFVDQSQTYGSAPEITYLLRESARTEAGDLIPDGHGGWIKTARLLDGAAEVGPDGVARGSLPSYADILVNNGVSRDAIDRLLADVAGNRMTNFDAWVELKSLNGFVDFDELGPTHLILISATRTTPIASPVGPDGTSNPYFSLENLLSYHIAGDHRADENVALTAVHTVWHREHNFQVERIKGAAPGMERRTSLPDRQDHPDGRIPARRVHRVRGGDVRPHPRSVARLFRLQSERQPRYLGRVRGRHVSRRPLDDQ